jgi:hypothetical protein
MMHCGDERWHRRDRDRTGHRPRSSRSASRATPRGSGERVAEHAKPARARSLRVEDGPNDTKPMADDARHAERGRGPSPT